MQYWWLWFILFLVLFVLPAQRARQLRRIRIAKKNRNKRKKGDFTMNELIKNYIGKEVVIYVSTSGVSGVVTKIEDNWVEVENKNGQKQLLNTDYISRIQEYPRNNKGKKKLVAV